MRSNLAIKPKFNALTPTPPELAQAVADEMATENRTMVARLFDISENELAGAYRVLTYSQDEFGEETDAQAILLNLKTREIEAVSGRHFGMIAFEPHPITKAEIERALHDLGYVLAMTPECEIELARRRHLLGLRVLLNEITRMIAKRRVTPSLALAAPRQHN